MVLAESVLSIFHFPKYCFCTNYFLMFCLNVTIIHLFQLQIFKCQLIETASISFCQICAILRMPLDKSLDFI